MVPMSSTKVEQMELFVLIVYCAVIISNLLIPTCVPTWLCFCLCQLGLLFQEYGFGREIKFSS